MARTPLPGQRARETILTVLSFERVPFSFNLYGRSRRFAPCEPYFAGTTVSFISPLRLRASFSISSALRITESERVSMLVLSISDLSSMASFSNSALSLAICFSRSVRTLWALGFSAFASLICWWVSGIAAGLSGLDVGVCRPVCALQVRKAMATQASVHPERCRNGRHSVFAPQCLLGRARRLLRSNGTPPGT
jgi:hypothetical protein